MGKKIWIGFFFVIITLSMFCHPIGIDYKGINNENRALTQFPDFPKGFGEFKEWPRKLETYLNDNIPFRTIMMKTYNTVVYHCGISPSEKVVLGKDDWIFGNSVKVMDQHIGRSILNPKSVKNFCEVIEQSSLFFENRNIPFYFFLAPNKHTIYPEYLPDYANNRLKVRRNFDNVMSYLNSKTDVKVIDVRHRLFKVKPRLPFLYYKTDTHWNNWGAYSAYLEVMDEIKRRETKRSLTKSRVISWDQIETRETDKQTDFAKNLGLWGKKKEKTQMPVIKERSQEKSVLLGKKGAFLAKETRVITTKNKNGPVLLLIRDSFSSAMTPFYEYSFSKIIVTHHNYGNWDSIVLEHGKPDIVIFQIVERYLSVPFKKKQFPQNFSYQSQNTNSNNKQTNQKK